MEFNLQRIKANGGRCQTRGGRPAKIIYYDANHPERPLIVLIEQMEGIEVGFQYKEDGTYEHDRQGDLVCEPESRSLKVFLNKDHNGDLYFTFGFTAWSVGSKIVTITEGKFADE